MDFFTVPTVTFKSLYCLFIINHDRRQILHFNITRHTTSSWIVQQLRRFLTNRPRNSCSLITTKHTAWKYLLPFAHCESTVCEPRSGVRGKTEWPSAGWKAVAVICSITSSLWTLEKTSCRLHSLLQLRFILPTSLCS